MTIERQSGRENEREKERNMCTYDTNLLRLDFFFRAFWFASYFIFVRRNKRRKKKRFQVIKQPSLFWANAYKVCALTLCLLHSKLKHFLSPFLNRKAPFPHRSTNHFRIICSRHENSVNFITEYSATEPIATPLFVATVKHFGYHHCSSPFLYCSASQFFTRFMK